MAEFLRLGLLGDPVAHSLSPAMQRAGLAALGIAGDYTLHRTSPAELPSRLAELAAAGYRGLNLTVPLKEAGYAQLAAGNPERLGSAARRLRAVNTLLRDGEGWWGDNTDPDGFRRAAMAFAGKLSGLRVVVLGAGGAARAVIVALADGGVREIAVWNRGAPRRERLFADLTGALGATTLVPLPSAGDHAPAEVDLVVQATSLGLRETDPLPPLPAPGSRPLAFDLITAATPWQAACERMGCRCADGREMLLHQGAAALSLWTGREAPLAAMRAALGDR